MTTGTRRSVFDAPILSVVAASGGTTLTATSNQENDEPWEPIYSDRIRVTHVDTPHVDISGTEDCPFDGPIMGW